MGKTPAALPGDHQPPARVEPQAPPDVADVIVVGGGPAGLMACAAAAEAGARVILLEKGDRLGRKLIISGGGRCNVTNRGEVADIIRQIPGNGRFLHGAFARFSNQDIIAFFEGLGVALKEEDHGRMFPVSNRAVDVAEALVGHLRRLGVHIRQGTSVAGLQVAEGAVRGVVLAGGETIAARAVVVAVGGMSVPRTGSTGDGYAWARSAGHTVTPLFPTEVPLTSDEPWIVDRRLQGLPLKEVALTLRDGAGKRLSTQVGDAIVTHFGFSGPAALRLGHYVSTARLADPDAPLLLGLDLRPDLDEEALVARVRKLAAEAPRKGLRAALKGELPERLLLFLLDRSGLDPEAPAAHLPKAGARRFAALAKRLEARITGTLSLAEAFVTGGGVRTTEVDPRTMASRLAEGLFFAGEVLDVHAHTGGYNITIAFSTGHVAGEAAARGALLQRAEGVERR